MRLLPILLSLSWLISFNAFGAFEPGFFDDTALDKASLSPAGTKVALLTSKGEQQRLAWLDVASKEKKLLLDPNKEHFKGSSIGQIEWIDDTHLAVEFSEDRKGLEELTDDKAVRHLLVITVTPKVVIRSVRTKGYLVSALPEEKGVLLYAKPGLYSKVYRVNVDKLAPADKRLSRLDRIDGGQFGKSNEVASIDGLATRWFISRDGQARAVLHRQWDKPKEKWRLLLSSFDQQGKASMLKEWDLDEVIKHHNEKSSFIPYAYTDKPDEFLALGTAEGDETKVYRVNYAKGSQDMVYQSNAFRVLGLIMSPQTRELTGIEVIRDGQLVREYITSEDKNVLKGTPFEHFDLRQEIGSSRNKKTALYYVEHHNQPGQYVLWQKSSNRTQVLGGKLAALNNKLTAQQTRGSVSVDKLDIPYLLNLPAKTKRPPLVVMPHGGPTGIFDTGYFDWETQFLVSQGFAVLRVNFRGSGGYSKALEEAGDRQWGDGMIADIVAATEQVIQKGLVNKERVCAMGFSYGGYAALMLSIERPDLYKCAVDLAGVTDVALFTRRTGMTTKRKEWANQHIGNAQTDYLQLKSISPVFLANKITVPVFIIHGEKDERVDIEHAYRLKLMLDKYEKPYRWLSLPEMGHSYGDVKQRKVLFDQIIPFLKSPA